ncbi:MAG: CDP-diacylglycerol--glycerol-3-phosphate 3-phosphatidyltransferase [Spirochaetes bacterium]|nr:CDP-diacylglycerol--glycerol-3-phosphate 3-phosphatidyltransferase [Spirochaetota bacterium]
MNIPNSLSVARIVLAPVFFIFFFMETVIPGSGIYSVIGVWMIFILIETSDLLDGYYARKLDLVSESGKILDPFADSISRLTYFLCFTGMGIMPVWIFLVLLYRDLGVGYIRQIASGHRVAFAARFSGKLKAWVYAVAGFVGILVFSVKKLLLLQQYSSSIELYSLIVFVLSALIAIWSLIDYTLSLLKIKNKN